MTNRRQALQSIALFSSAIAAIEPQAQTPAATDSALLQSQVAAAFEYAFPVYEMARTRYQMVQKPIALLALKPNSLHHVRKLSDDTSRTVTAPNNDTLYSVAWLDLSNGPVRINVGAMPQGRYWSVALMDAFTNNFAMLGQRLDGQGPVSLSLVAAGQSTKGLTGRIVAAPGNDVWLLARILVDGPGSLDQTHAMQDQLELLPSAPGGWKAQVVPTQSTNPENFLAVVNEWLARNPPPMQEQAMVQNWAAVGLRPGVTDAWAQLSDAARAAWNARIAPSHELLRSQEAQQQVQGWTTAPPQIGNFGNNYALRAQVALSGLAALEPVEAMYFNRANDNQGQALNGAHRYRVVVPAGGVPTDSFWSITMYEQTADGRLFFSANPLARYAIGNRTAGLQTMADGSLVLWLQHQQPSAAEQQANWLPAPSGRFVLILRAYLPKQALRDHSAALPTVERL